ncbi:MAG: Asd/ArgC dimerization domain-containing protein, partial [Bryobacteraceae bacterium]
MGSDTLLGHEIREVLESSASGTVIDGFAANGEASFGEKEGEAVYREPLSAGALKSCEAIVCAGSEAGALKAYELAKASRGAVKLIDCSGYLDQKPEARICAPLIEGGKPGKGWLLVPAQPAAASISAVLLQLAGAAAIERAVIDIFEPASERGSKGIAELQQQTANLLSFRPLEKHIFDAQLSFNLLPAYGEEAPVQLAAVEQRIEMHLATVLARGAQSGRAVPMPSIRLIQAPVFHGYSFSAWVQFGANVALEDIAQSLVSQSIDVRSPEQEIPTNAESAGHSGITVGNVRVDRNNPRAVWLWMVTDNLR